MKLRPGIGRLWWKYLLLMVVAIAPIELLGYAAGRVLVSKKLMFDRMNSDGFAEYLETRDPLLGWPSSSAFGNGEYDETGSRIVPRFPDTSASSCVALFGDSFTWGDEVTPAQAYGNVLADLLGCRVANYGVGGYGTDQALLRYEQRIEDPAPVVVLGHYSENIIRNVNRVRDLMAGARFGLKPRFIFDATGELALLPIPDLTPAQYAQLDALDGGLAHEFFAPGGPSGLPVLKAPFLVSAVRALGNYRVQARLRGEPSYAQFYQADHPSGGLPITVAILRRFVRLAESRGQRPVVLVIPDAKDLAQLRDSDALPYAPLLSALESDGIRTPPLAEHLLAYLGDREPCAIYTSCGGNAHFNPEGYAQVARAVYDWLEVHGLRASADER